METQVEFYSSIPKIIFKKDNEEIYKPIQELEIINTIWTLHLDKAPGPTGFTINIYRSAWYLIKNDLCKMLNRTKNKEKIEAATNTTFFCFNS